MRKFFYNISSGNPKVLIPSIFWSTVESMIRLLPAVIAFFGIKELFETYVSNRNINATLYIWLALASFIWFVLQCLVSSIAYDKNYLAAYDVSATGRTKLANHLRKLSLGFLDTKDPGDLTSMMLGDYTLVETAVSHHVPQAVSSCILLVMAFVSLVMIDWRMTLCLYVMLPFVFIIIGGTNQYQRRLGQTHVQAKVDSASRLQEYLYGIKEIKSYSLGGDKFARLEEAFNRLKRESIRLEAILGPLVMSTISVLRMGLPILVFVGTYLLTQGSMTDAVFLAFIVIASRIYDPFTTMMLSYTEMKYGALSAERIMDIRHQPEVVGTLKMPNDYTITFDQVHFAYQERMTLRNINLVIKPKTMTALVGPSGSGKSTIVKLIARFYDVNQGQITIGNTKISDIVPENLYSHISMVFQDVYLFKDTILNNIKVGNQQATFEEVVAAAKQAQCHDFIMALPNGYDTLVGEGGSTLSGGEKQRISIARAFIKQAEIILLDEATAALDLENEKAVQTAISNLVKDKTVIVIAHRLRTVKDADNIVVLQQGEMLAQGTHDKLYQECELYHHLVDLQDQAQQWSFMGNQ